MIRCDGDPVGHWEGETLVIDSTNFKRWQPGRLLLHEPEGIPDAQRRAPHRAHSLEEQDRALVRITIDDPKIFTKPWSQEFESVAKPEWEKVGLFEYVCDNNRCPGGKCGTK
jgi:hypothetical protein